MCRRIECPVCRKPTFAGCGLHVEEVLSDVPPAARCTCAAQPSTGARPSSTAGRTPPRPGER